MAERATLEMLISLHSFGSDFNLIFMEAGNVLSDTFPAFGF